MSDKKSPLARFVLFMVCLALLGCVIAGAHYIAVDLPAQKNLQAPENGVSSLQNCGICEDKCVLDPDYWRCYQSCEDLVCPGILK